MKIIDTYGETNQLSIAQEECAELIQAISKLKRCDLTDSVLYNDCVEHIKEEIADVIVCIDQIMLILEILGAEIEPIAQRKINRHIRRIEDEQVRRGNERL